MENYCRTRTRIVGGVADHKIKDGKCEFCGKPMEAVKTKKSQGIVKKVSTKKEKPSIFNPESILKKRNRNVRSR